MCFERTEDKVLRSKIIIGKGVFDKSMIGNTCELIIKDGIQCVDLTKKGDVIIIDGGEKNIGCEVFKYVDCIIHRRRRGEGG